MALLRLNKYLAENAGVSRREADRLIESGRVLVNGSVAAVGLRVDDTTDRVQLDDEPVVKRRISHFYAVNKPAGYISSTVKQAAGDRLVTEIVQSGVRLFPMGRLDKDSEGLIILTDDGELMDKVLRSRNGHEKEYIAVLDSKISDEELAEIAAGGLDIGEGRRTKPCRIARMDGASVSVVLTEGMNRQIRKMFALYGHNVTKLKRVRFMNVMLGDMKPGEYRRLTDEELEGMRDMVR
ncbi:MAG: rRNA pseudouridine synthase [Lachnospiraceae bacterium]|nr:rRNA pseudouridine synthase [Lachnospiraceae bacterium]